MANIAIIGAGLLGRFLALLLAPQHKVTLYEKSHLQDERATGRIAAAMVAPAAESAHASELVVQIGMQSCQLWQPLLSASGLKTRFTQTGSLLVAHRQDLPELRHFQQQVKYPELVEPISKSRLMELESELQTDFAGALWLPMEGHIDNRQLYQELECRLQDSNVKINEGLEVSVDANQVASADGTTTYDWVIDCRGTGAKTALANGERSLRGVRGEVIRIKAPEVHLNRPIRLMHPRYPIYIVPKSDDQYVIGATEIESENPGGVTVRSSLELLSAAYSVHRGFAEAEILAFDVGFRPTFTDHQPKIILEPGKSIQINGLYRHGYLLAPWILMRTLRILKDAELVVPDFKPLPDVPDINHFDSHLLEILCK